AALVAQQPARDAAISRRERLATDTLRLPFEAAITRALRVSDELRLAEAQVEAADAQVGIARATGLPQLRANSGYTNILNNARAEIVGALFNQNYVYTANAQLQQVLFQGGRVLAGTRAAGAFRNAARSSVAEVRAQLVVDVARAYLDARFARRLVDIQRRNLALADERVATTEQLERAGRAARYDVLRIKVERANFEPDVVAAVNQEVLAQLELRRLLNVPAEQPLDLATDLDSTFVARLVADVDTNATGAVRPAVRAAELTRVARDAGVRVARADYLPQLSFTYTNGFLALPTANRFPTNLGESSNALCPPGSPATRICQNNGWFPDRQFGLVLSWPLFQGLRVKSNVELAQAQRDQADVQLVQAREQVAIEAAAARAEFGRARTVWVARRQTVSEAREAFTLADLRNARGLGTLVDVSFAQLNLLRAEVNAARAVYDVYLAAAELARATARPIPLLDGTALAITERGTNRLAAP
ncbi:MAG: TolC family protein, partial [Gemmatimonadaceae bacterium]|nr:TolC family protein [Gemmatimonadaceae bacterium]